MLSYTFGNILESDTDALVNTVNCDGYMGKGIAYQFKLKFPKNNEVYEKACKNGDFKIGNILSYKEQDKTILNFPTKDHWRNKSKLEFIELGLETLVDIIKKENINSISIPPLGCGNGGLNWEDVRPLIEKKLLPISNGKSIMVFEPIQDYSKLNKEKAKTVPKLNTSHLLLMLIKDGLEKFNKIRLQKSAYLVNIFSGQDYFKFEAHNFGPYAHSIDILSRNIKEYQDFYKIDTAKAYNQAKATIISTSMISKLNNFSPSLNYTLNFVNSINEDSKLELYTTIIFLIKSNIDVDTRKLISLIHDWNEHKKASFSEASILEAVDFLIKQEIIFKDLYGLQLKRVDLVNKN